MISGVELALDLVDEVPDVLEIWERWNESDDGRLVLPQEYLLSVIRL